MQAGLAAGADVVAAWKAAREGRASSRTSRELERAHQRATVAYEKQLRAERARAAREKARVTGWTAAAGVTGSLGVIGGVAAVAAAQPEAAPLLLLAAAGGSTVMAVRARWRMRARPAPSLPPAPVAPPPVLRPGARGQAEAERLMRTRVQLAEVVPAVAALHPGAGQELARADAEAAPALHALVERLAVLDRIERDMPGTFAAVAAAQAAEEVRARLATGIDTYERLIAAAAAMLAAPDLGRSSEAVLGPAIDALTAYAEGLSVSAQAFDR